MVALFTKFVVTTFRAPALLFVLPPRNTTCAHFGGEHHNAQNAFLFTTHPDDRNVRCELATLYEHEQTGVEPEAV
jgi:hypothetical protein